jgi:hypothetical protein
MAGAQPHTVRNRTGRRAPSQKSNYELFNCNNFNIRYWSWNYRGCWPMFTGIGIALHFLSAHFPERT